MCLVNLFLSNLPNKPVGPGSSPHISEWRNKGSETPSDQPKATQHWQTRAELSSTPKPRLFPPAQQSDISAKAASGSGWREIRKVMFKPFKRTNYLQRRESPGVSVINYKLCVAY